MTAFIELTMRKLAVRILVGASLCTSWRADLSAQSDARMFGSDGFRIKRGTMSLVDDMALQNWTLDVFSRRDGWVEMDLATISRGRFPLPWLMSDRYRGKLGSPIWSRAYFSPADIRKATRFADSLLDKTIPPEAYRKRFPDKWPTVLNMPRGVGQASESGVFYWYMGAPRVQLGVADSVIEFGFGTCLGVSQAGPALLGRGVTRTLKEFRAFLRAMDLAADRSEAYSRDPQPLHADLIDAEEAACMALPRRENSRPVYPATADGNAADVHVDANVDTSGSVDPRSVKIISSAGPIFDKAASESIAGWRFYAALLTKATPVPQRVHVHFHFAPTVPSNAEMDLLLDDAARHGAEFVVVSRPKA
jgi:TonB family protein